MRVLRVVRPLRIVSKSEQLKIAINALVNSVPMLIPLIMFCGMFFFLFGIVGVQFFKVRICSKLSFHPVQKKHVLFYFTDQFPA